MTSEGRTPRGNQLPPTVHAVLLRERIGKGRIIVVGDIHGCSRELQDLLSKCNYKHGEDTVVLVGDLVGKGPNSLEVLREVQSKKHMAVRGNWDENALAVHASCQETGADYEAKWQWLTGASQADIDYMNSMPFSLSIPTHGCLVTHAGLVPGVALQDQNLYDLIEMRHVDLIDKDSAQDAGAASKAWKSIPKFPREAGHPWATIWPGPSHVIFGHHARRRLQACSFASGIDTGCCHGDQLTALVLPPLADLEARKWAPPKEGVTRESLGAKLVSIPAREKYAN